MADWKPKPAYQQIYWSDFLSSTLTMSDDGAHAYLFLLGRAWEDGGLLRDDDDFLRRAARMAPRRWAKCRAEVLERFERAGDGRLFNARVLADLAKVQSNRQAQSGNSKKRWESVNGQEVNPKEENEKPDVTPCDGEKPNEFNDHSDAAASDRVSPPSPTPSPDKGINQDSSPDPAPSEPEGTEPSAAAHGNGPPSAAAGKGSAPRQGSLIPDPPPAAKPPRLPMAFEAWWNRWTITGTKRGKAGAERRYEQVIRSAKASHEQLCQGVDRYMAHCRVDGVEPAKIKHPETWLSKGCWADEYPPPSRASPWPESAPSQTTTMEINGEPVTVQFDQYRGTEPSPSRSRGRSDGVAAAAARGAELFLRQRRAQRP